MARVEVISKASGRRDLFPYNDTLYTWNSETLVERAKNVDYRITAYTNNFPDAGFDGQVGCGLGWRDSHTVHVQCG